MIILLLGLNGWVLGNKIQKASSQEIHSLPTQVKIGGIFPLLSSEPIRLEAARDRRDAFRIAINEINNQTGVNRILPEGVTLVPNVQGDDDSALGGTQAAQNLISWGADIVIGSSVSSASIAVATELTPHKIPQISYASSSPSLSNRLLYPYFMRVTSSDSDQAKAIADLVADFNWTKGALIHSDDSYGMGLPTYFKQFFEDHGGTVLTDQTFQATFPAPTVSTQIEAIKNSNPEFILGHFIDVDAATVMVEAKLQGIDTIPWIMTDGWSMASAFGGDSTVQDAMQKAIGTSPAPILGAGYQDFNDTWFDPTWNWLEGPNNSQNTGVMFNHFAPFAYDAVYIAAKGLAAAGTTDDDTLLSTLYNVTHDGASQKYIEFNALGEVYGRFAYMQLINQSFNSFGVWDGTPTLKTGTLSLNDGSSWNFYYFPTINIESPLEQTYQTKTINIALSGNANHYWYYIESVDSQNQTWPTSVDRTLTGGTYTLHVYGNDSIGNIAHVFVTFTISTTTTTTTTSATTTPATTTTPSWNALLLLLSLFVMLSWRQRKKKS